MEASKLYGLKPIIFEEYPGLEKLPWMELGEFPTPVEHLKRFGEAIGLENLYIKRDDRSSKLYGGNKVRKLEFILADAKERGRRTLITAGAVGSNQVLATGIYGRQLGFRVIGIVMDQPNAEYVRRNLLLDHHFGVELHHTHSMTGAYIKFFGIYLKELLLGHKPYLVPPGASSPLGNVGYVNAAFELRSQIEEGLLPEPDNIIVAAGSLGTAAGLYLGCRLAGLKTRVLAIQVAMPSVTNLRKYVELVNETARFMRRYDESIPEMRVSEDDLTLITDYLGEGYAYFTEEGVRTVELMRELEDIQLEHTYTGKALGGGVDWLKRHGLSDKVTLFWNTYNSVDLTHLIEGADYHELPRPLHRYFEEPTQEENWGKP
ncbi:pyridoxal-phosphate dependent enzyme [Candidatus Bathyarchaeota archaeon]|nr:pyridoxal-phosphate dependent enzyme [Candidatus Bathyarchaeota archaeon]